MNVLSRVEAKAQGEKRYLTGKVCRNGHTAERYTSSGHCVECVASQRKQWQKDNPEQTRRFWKAYQTKNPEKCRAAALRSYYKNPEALKLWRKNHPDKVRMNQYNWRKNHPAAVAAQASRRRAAKLNRTPAWVDNERVKAYYDVCAFFNDVNGYAKYHVDHIIPLRGARVSGLHVHNNLQVILAEDNLRKGNRV